MSATGTRAATGTAAAGQVEGDAVVGGGESAVTNKSHRPQQLSRLNTCASGADGRFAGLSEGLSFLENSVAVVTLIFV